MWNTVFLWRVENENTENLMPNKRDPNRTTAGLSINKDTLAELRRIANEQGTNVSNLLERFAEQIINERKNEKPTSDKVIKKGKAHY